MPQISENVQSLAIRALFILGLAIVALAFCIKRPGNQALTGKSQ